MAACEAGAAIIHMQAPTWHQEARPAARRVQSGEVVWRLALYASCF